jgi:Family of unknown function (DUF5994)
MSTRPSHTTSAQTGLAAMPDGRFAVSQHSRAVGHAAPPEPGRDGGDHPGLGVASKLPSLPRLFLTRTPAQSTRLHGGWWPHSYDPLAELPGLVLALCARYGPMREIRLRRRDWRVPFAHLVVGDGTVRLSWSDDEPDVLTAVTARDNPLDLLVVAPHTDAETAKRAMTLAADPTNALLPHDILASVGYRTSDRMADGDRPT